MQAESIDYHFGDATEMIEDEELWILAEAFKSYVENLMTDPKNFFYLWHLHHRKGWYDGTSKVEHSSR